MKKISGQWGELGVFISALGLRVLFAREWASTPYFLFPLVDAKEHESWALSIVSGHWMRAKAFYGSPFYPYLLASIYKLFGHRPALVVALQVVLGAITCVLIQRIAARCFGPRAGLFAGILAAIYRPFIFVNALLLKETWVAAGLALSCLAIFEVEETGKKRHALFFGIALGWTAISRGNLLLLVPSAAFYWLWKSKELFKRLTPAFLLGILLTMLPATVHNLIVSKDLVLNGYADGFVFYVSNNPEAKGILNYPHGLSSATELEEAQITRIAEAESGRSLKPSGVSHFWFRKGLGFIRAEPKRALTLLGERFFLFWNRFEPPDNYCLQFVQEHFSSILRWPLASYGLIATLGILGACLSFASGANSRLLVGGGGIYILSILPFWMSDRFRLPVTVFMIPFAAAALDEFFKPNFLSDWRRWKNCLYALPILALCWAPPLYDPEFKALESVGWSQLTVMYSDMGRPQEALDCLGRALSKGPESVTEAAFDRGAATLDDATASDKALALYALALKVHPDSAQLYHNQGTTMFRMAQRTRDARLLGQAISSIEEAVKIDPEYALAYKNLFNIFLSVGDKKSALEFGRKALSLAPDDSDLKRRFDRIRI